MENYEIPVHLEGIVKEIDHNVDAPIKDPKSTRLLIEMPWSPVSLGEKVTVIIDFGDGSFRS